MRHPELFEINDLFNESAANWRCTGKTSNPGLQAGVDERTIRWALALPVLRKSVINGI